MVTPMHAHTNEQTVQDSSTTTSCHSAATCFPEILSFHRDHYEPPLVFFKANKHSRPGSFRSSIRRIANEYLRYTVRSKLRDSSPRCYQSYKFTLHICSTRYVTLLRDPIVVFLAQGVACPTLSYDFVARSMLKVIRRS